MSSEYDSEKAIQPSSIPNSIAPAVVQLPDDKSNASNTGIQEIDPLLVTWNGDDDPESPYNWSSLKKWSVIILTSFSGLVCLMSGTMMAPALGLIGHDLDLDIDTTQLALSIYTLAYAVGPLVFAPASELYGRRPVWLVCGVIYVIFNTVCGFATNSATIIACRFLAGLGASAEFAITIPVLADTFRAEQRGKGLAWSSLIPLLGTCIGPVIGGVIAQNLSWRWIFWIISMIAAVTTLAGFFTFKETYSPVLLKRKAKGMRQETGQAYYSATEKTMPNLPTKLKISLARPFKLLTHPIILLCAAIQGYCFGINYIMLSTYAELWTSRYGETVTQSGLHYLSIGLGNLIASQAGGWIMDKIYARLKKTHGIGRAEFRVPNMLPGIVMVPLGLFWYGWAAESRVFWLVTDLGNVVYACGLILTGQALGAYIVDAYRDYSASAFACSTLFKSLGSFAFPIFAPQMYKALGYGWGNSVLGFVSLAIGIPAPWILWRYGQKLRSMGKAID